jgi:hypothetical protein
MLEKVLERLGTTEGKREDSGKIRVPPLGARHHAHRVLALG